MKNFSIMFLAFIGFATGASAVETKQCPTNITVSIQGIDPLSDAQIDENYESQQFGVASPEEAKEVRDLLKKVNIRRLKNVKMERAFFKSG